MSELDAFGVLEGPDRAAPVTTVGAVYAVDETGRAVQVAVRGSAMWLPAQPGRYLLATPSSGGTGLARVLLNPTTSRPVLVLGPVNPRNPSLLATLTAINTTTKVATVTLDGVSYNLPYMAATYTVGDPVWVDLNDWGTPYRVGGATTAPTVPVIPAAPPVAPTTPTTVQATITVPAQWSGSYRAGSGWDRWNTGRYGGRSTLYQGNGYGSGAMTGLATYGDQLVNLNAVSIDRVQVVLNGVGLSGASGPIQVQGSSNASQPGGAPSSSGATANGDGLTDLPAGILSAMLAGTVKGLCTVGSNYWAVAGAGNGDGMNLLVTYTRAI